MEIMEPAKAARIMAPEPMDTDLLKRKIISSATISLAPEEIPSTNGPAIGLLKNVCSRNPDTDNDNCQNSRKTDLPHNIIGSLISLTFEYDIQDLIHREMDTSGIYIPYK